MTLHVDIQSDPDEREWEEAVCARQEGHVSQSSFWGRYLSACGHDVRYLTVRDADGHLLACLMGFIEVRAKAGTAPGFGSRLRHAASGLYPMLRIVNGPLFLSGTPEPEVDEAIWAEISRWVRDRGICEVRGFGPIHVVEGIADYRPPAAVAAQVRPMATILVDLQVSEEALWQGVDRSVRKAVRRCSEAGITVRRIEGRDDLARYVELLAATRARLGMEMPPMYPNDIMWDALRPGGHLEIFIAEHADLLCHGLGVLTYNGLAHEIALARDDSIGGARYAGELVKWEILRWARATGHRLYDLAGVAAGPADAKEEGIRTYKAKFGGAYLEFPEYVLEGGGLRAGTLRWLRRHAT